MDKKSKQNLRLKELKDLRSSSEEDVEHQNNEQVERGEAVGEVAEYDFQGNKTMLQQILQYKLVTNRIAALRYVNSI